MTEPRGTEGPKGPEGPEGPDSPTGRLCPECGAPRAADNTPSCDCAERVGEALRDARTAEAAAAEDFDPLRIRPYVELAGDGATMPLRAVPPAGPRPAPPPAAEPASTLATPLAPPPATPGARDLHDAADRADRRRRRRHTVLLGVGGALVTVLAAAGLASGLLTYETPSRDKALPDDIRASIPVPSTSEASAEPSPSGTSARPTQAPAAPSPTRSASPTPSPSRSSASPAPSPSAEPTKAPASAGAEASGALGESIAGAEAPPPTLRRGDRGPEVTELELRLTQLGLYTREAQGSYNEGVEDAVTRYQWARGIQPPEYGVYDLATRERLESETTEP